MAFGFRDSTPPTSPAPAPLSQNRHSQRLRKRRQSPPGISTGAALATTPAGNGTVPSGLQRSTRWQTSSPHASTQPRTTSTQCSTLAIKLAQQRGIGHRSDRHRNRRHQHRSQSRRQCSCALRHPGPNSTLRSHSLRPTQRLHHLAEFHRRRSESHLNMSGDRWVSNVLGYEPRQHQHRRQQSSPPLERAPLSLHRLYRRRPYFTLGGRNRPLGKRMGSKRRRRIAPPS